MYGSEFTYKKSKDQYFFTKHVSINVRAENLKEAKRELRKIIKKRLI